MKNTIDLNVVISERAIRILGLAAGFAVFYLGCTMVARSLK